MNLKANLNTWLSVWVLVLLSAGQAADGGIIKVPLEYPTIQAAIDSASNGDEIWVSPGIYNEAINFNGKAVRLSSMSGPDVTTIDANGIAGAYHVVQCVNGEGPDTVLEGFTITGGNANGLVYPDDCGGGMYNNDSGPTVTNCIFTDNAAVYGGGGMYNYDYSWPTVTNCVFIGNTTTGVGGGMGNEYGSHSSVTDCNFINNTANWGGGMYNYESNPSVNNCTFSDNTANDGGGVLNEGSGPMVTNCTLSGNEAIDGGGMINLSSDTIVTNCTFSGNTADYFGGGMLNQSDSNPKVTNCKFNENEASNGGGMLNSAGSDSTVTNCTFSGNTASDAGGGIYNNDSQPRLRNCTLTSNTASIGGGMFHRRCWPTLTNCILWGDTPDEIIDTEGYSKVYYCDIQGGWSGIGNNNIDADPCFVNASSCDLRLSTPASPCVDAGDSTLLLVGKIYLDLDGKHRYVDIDSVDDTGYGPLEFLDIGAYEFNCNYTAGDSNCDGVVNFKDLAILCNNWLAGAGPEL